MGPELRGSNTGQRPIILFALPMAPTDAVAKPRGLHDLSVDLTAADEDALFDQRLRRLLEHPGNWADHHHLAGTTAEVAAGQRGNYSALVS